MASMLPKQYAWLRKEPGPKMLLEALKLYGIREFAGKQHNPVILAWAKALHIENIYKDDETAWCGLAHAIVATRAGKQVDLKGYDLLRAKKWAFFGLRVDKPMLGDTLIFEREGGGHVGLYVGEDNEYFHVLGGNQDNAYNIKRLKKGRLFQARRPVYVNQPANIRKIILKPEGSVSTNEQ